MGTFFGGAITLFQLFSSIVLVFNILILLPLSFVGKTRGFSAVGFYISSYVFGLELWIRSLLLTYVIWGGFWVAVGLLFFGIGVLPMALIATLIDGSFLIFGSLCLSAFMVYGARTYGLYLAEKLEKEKMTKFNVKLNELLGKTEILDEE